jgi:hypothetical protein
LDSPLVLLVVAAATLHDGKPSATPTSFLAGDSNLFVAHWTVVVVVLVAVAAVNWRPH